MDTRHQEYVEYYRARLARCQGNPLYPHTEAAERAMFEAISTASSLEEFRERLQRERLELRCAVARVRDQESARAHHYMGLEEPVRAQPHLEVLRLLDERSFDDVMALTSAVSEIHTRWNLAISADETLIEQFWGDWKILEDIEEAEHAEVPAQWHEERRARVQRELEAGARQYREVSLLETRKFIPDYQPDYAALDQVRHRRKMPVADPVVARRIAGHKRYRGLS